MRLFHPAAQNYQGLVAQPHRGRAELFHADGYGGYLVGIRVHAPCVGVDRRTLRFDLGRNVRRRHADQVHDTDDAERRDRLYQRG